MCEYEFGAWASTGVNRLNQVDDYLDSRAAAALFCIVISHF